MLIEEMEGPSVEVMGDGVGSSSIENGAEVVNSIESGARVTSSMVLGDGVGSSVGSEVAAGKVDPVEGSGEGWGVGAGDG